MQTIQRSAMVTVLYPPGKQRIALWTAVAKHLKTQTPAEKIARCPWSYLNQWHAVGIRY